MRGRASCGGVDRIFCVFLFLLGGLRGGEEVRGVGRGKKKKGAPSLILFPSQSPRDPRHTSTADTAKPQLDTHISAQHVPPPHPPPGDRGGGGPARPARPAFAGRPCPRCWHPVLAPGAAAGGSTEKGDAPAPLTPAAWRVLPKHGMGRGRGVVVAGPQAAVCGGSHQLLSHWLAPARSRPRQLGRDPHPSRPPDGALHPTRRPAHPPWVCGALHFARTGTSNTAIPHPHPPPSPLSLGNNSPTFRSPMGMPPPPPPCPPARPPWPPTRGPRPWWRPATRPASPPVAPYSRKPPPAGRRPRPRMVAPPRPSSRAGPRTPRPPWPLPVASRPRPRPVVPARLRPPPPSRPEPPRPGCPAACPCSMSE